MKRAAVAGNEGQSYPYKVLRVECPPPPYGGEVSVSRGRDRDSRGVTNARRDRDRDRGAFKTHLVGVSYNTHTRRTEIGKNRRGDPDRPRPDI